MTWNRIQPPNDPAEQELRRALAELPRERAAEGFTEQVLRRLDETAAASRVRKHRFRRFLLGQPALAGAAAVAALAVAVLVGVLVVSRGPGPADDGAVPTEDEPTLAVAQPTAPTAPAETSSPVSETPGAGRQQIAATLDELRRERLRLERDLRDLRVLAEGSRVLYIGGDENLDFVLDLEPGRPGAGGTEMQPAKLPGARPGGDGGPRYF